MIKYLHKAVGRRKFLKVKRIRLANLANRHTLPCGETPPCHPVWVGDDGMGMPEEWGLGHRPWDNLAAQQNTPCIGPKTR